MTNRDFDQQTEGEAIDWLQIVFGVALIILLVLAAVSGHHQVSLGVN